MKLMAANKTKEPLISIVDEEACVRESLSSLMRSVGYDAKEYASAEDFLTWGWWDEAACLILDVRLPAMGGLELQRYLAGKQPERPIVFISGHATENEQTWAMMKGAVAFLRKPFDDESLLKAVRRSIARGRAGFDRDPAMQRNRVCPLCHEPARVAEIPERIIHEQDELHASTVTMIKILNLEWVEQDGLCERCWRFYVDLGRRQFLRSPEAPPEANRNRESKSTAWVRQKE
jgi:FixJ family two-component response regulator